MDSRLKKYLIRGALIGAAAAAAIASAATFNLFQPANGLLVGNPSTYITTAATSGNVIPLWAGTCNNTTYLRGDGQCVAPPGTGGGTVSSVGLTMPSGFSVGGSPVTGSSVLAVTTTLSGVLKGTGSGFSAAAASDVVALFSGCTGTDYLGADVACHAAGTVTSVALTAPSVFAVGGTPVTGAGTLAITFATGQTANEVLASPNGSSGAIGLRALVGADIPAINLAGTGNGGVTGSLPFASLTITSANVISLWTTGGTCSATTYLRGDGSCITPGGGGTVTSIGLSAPSVFTVGSTPITSSGTLALTFAGGQTANEFLASPNGTSGAVGLRSIVAGDLPSSITSNTSGNAATASATNSAPTQCSSGQYSTGITSGFVANCAQVAYSQLSGAPTVPSAANPSTSIGLSTVNGTASTWMRSDAAPALSQSIAPTWTGFHAFQGGITINPSGAASLAINSTGTPEQGFIAFGDSAAPNNAFIGWAGSLGDLILGAARGSLNIRTNASGINFSVNSGSTAAVAIGATGGLNIIQPTASAVTALNVVGGAGANVAQFSQGTNLQTGIVITDGQTGTVGWTLHAGYCGGSSPGTFDLYNSTAANSVWCWATSGGMYSPGATGSSKGTGTVNAQGLFVNGVAVLTSSGAGVSKIAAAGIAGTSGGCTVVGGAGIASCAPNGTGQWQMNFTTSFFTTTPICSVTGNNSSVANNGVFVSSPGSTAFDALAFTTNTGSLLASSNFYVICVGT